MAVSKAMKVVSVKVAKKVKEVPAPKAKKAKGVLGKFSKAAAKKVESIRKTKKAAKKVATKPVVDEKTIVEARTKELKSMLVADLKELALSKGLEKGTKETLVASLLALDAKARENARAQEAKAKEVVKKMKDDLDAMSNDEVKELCRAKQLPLGGSKTDRVARLLDVAKKAGDVEKALLRLAAEERRAELLAMDKSTLLAACKKAGVDPLLKELMVERLVQHETMAK